LENADVRGRKYEAACLSARAQAQFFHVKADADLDKCGKIKAFDKPIARKSREFSGIVQDGGTRNGRIGMTEIALSGRSITMPGASLGRASGAGSTRKKET
jgi:hypothetical protein